MRPGLIAGAKPPSTAMDYFPSPSRPDPLRARPDDVPATSPPIRTSAFSAPIWPRAKCAASPRGRRPGCRTCSGRCRAALSRRTRDPISPFVFVVPRRLFVRRRTPYVSGNIWQSDRDCGHELPVRPDFRAHGSQFHTQLDPDTVEDDIALGEAVDAVVYANVEARERMLEFFGTPRRSGWRSTPTRGGRSLFTTSTRTRVSPSCSW